MFQAQYLPASTAVYSPWMERKGDRVNFTVEVQYSIGSNQLTVECFTKNKTETDDGAAATGSAVVISASNTRTTTEYSALEELVRFKMATNGTGTGTLFRILPPVFFDVVKA